MPTEAARTLETAAKLIERSQRSPRSAGGGWVGCWPPGPEIIAYREDGTTEHVAEARAGSARWIATMSPATAPALVRWLRRAARHEPVDAEALSFARALLDSAEPAGC